MGLLTTSPTFPLHPSHRPVPDVCIRPGSLPAAEYVQPAPDHPLRGPSLDQKACHTVPGVKGGEKSEGMKSEGQESEGSLRMRTFPRPGGWSGEAPQVWGVGRRVQGRRARVRRVGCRRVMRVRACAQQRAGLVTLCQVWERGRRRVWGRRVRKRRVRGRRAHLT